MKSFHLIKTSIGAGWALRQIRELVSLGIVVHVALPEGGPLVGEYSAVGATEHLFQTDFPIRSPWMFPALAVQFRRLVNEIKPDIIHSHFVGTTLTMRLALGRSHSIPRVFQVPGPLHLEHPFFRNTEIATAGFADHWIGSCQWTCDRYGQSGIENGRIHLSYYGGDLDAFQQRTTGSLRKELGVDYRTKIIGMVAFMYAPKAYLGQRRGLKGHEDLIDAVAICKQKFPDLLCVIIGGAWNNKKSYEDQVRRYAATKCGDKVIFLGTRHDVPDLYPDIDVAVHPSHSENVGGAVESLMNAIPTIASNVGGFPDLVRPGDTGWLVPPKSPEILADAIMEVLNNSDHARCLARRGQVLANNLFDVRRTATEVADIYEKICSRNIS
ncbi:glycosyltransferase family 4 protein [Candidatus Roizmanbacteria bacterium]|nr:glycosyltransferase family 4 protein [Candidatus Roizmanbacteria bacterium]